MEHVQQWSVAAPGIDGRPGGCEEPNSPDMVAECGGLHGERGWPSAPASSNSRMIGVWPRVAATERIVAMPPHVSFGSAPSDSNRRTCMVSPCLTALYNGVCSITRRRNGSARLE